MEMMFQPLPAMGLFGDGFEHDRSFESPSQDKYSCIPTAF